MILVDTSVVVAHLRKPSPALREIFRLGNCAICGVVRAEILHGARNFDDAASLISALEIFRHLPISEQLWDTLGAHLATLRMSGISLPFQDVLIATLAIEFESELWSYDRHFQTIQTVYPALKLFVGPNP